MSVNIDCLQKIDVNKQNSEKKNLQKIRNRCFVDFSKRQKLSYTIWGILYIIYKYIYIFIYLYKFWCITVY